MVFSKRSLIDTECVYPAAHIDREPELVCTNRRTHSARYQCALIAGSQRRRRQTKVLSVRAECDDHDYADEVILKSQGLSGEFTPSGLCESPVKISFPANGYLEILIVTERSF